MTVNQPKDSGVQRPQRSDVMLYCLECSAQTSRLTTLCVISHEKAVAGIIVEESGFFFFLCHNSTWATF